jgi:hypothetical protein
MDDKPDTELGGGFDNQGFSANEEDLSVSDEKQLIRLDKVVIITKLKCK